MKQFFSNKECDDLLNNNKLKIDTPISIKKIMQNYSQYANVENSAAFNFNSIHKTSNFILIVALQNTVVKPFKLTKKDKRKYSNFVMNKGELILFQRTKWILLPKNDFLTVGVEIRRRSKRLSTVMNSWKSYRHKIF